MKQRKKEIGKIYIKAQAIVFAMFFCVSILVSPNAKAQTISMDQLPIEDALRRLQLMGKIESDISFMSRPLQPTKIGAWDSALKWLDPVYFKKGLHPISKKFLGNTFYATVLPLQVTGQYVTEHPFQELDGPMVASSGRQTYISGGVYLKLGPLTIQYQPQFVWAENKNYRGTIQTPNYNYPFLVDYSNSINNLFYNILDNPLLKNNLLGNSSIRLNLGLLSLGVSSENLSWGPTLMNPLVISAHSPGFKHLTFNSNHPFRTKIGSFEWNWIAGFLEPEKTIFKNISDASADNPTPRRYINAGMFAFSPNRIKGMSIGLFRLSQQPNIILNESKDWNLIFKNISRVNDKSNFVPSFLGSNEDNTDHYAGFFLRFKMPSSHAEFYSEWARNDAFYNFRDLIQNPEHSRAYTYGFRKLFNFTETSFIKYYDFNIEYTRIQQPSTWPVRNAGKWYIHGYFPGIINLGQIIGAPIGSGGNYFMMRLSKFEGMKQLAIQLESTTKNADDYEGSGLAFQNPSKTKWVDMGFRILYDHPYKHFLLSASLIAKRSFNYNFSQPVTATGFGFENPNDLDSFLLKIGLRYL